MSQGRTLRWTDIFALVGLLLLVVGIPASIATDDGREADGFTLRPPRIGDRAVLDLIVTDADGETTRVGPLVEILFRAPRPGEIPYESDFVIERHYHAVDMRFDVLKVDVEGLVVAEYLDAGDLVHVQKENATTHLSARANGHPFVAGAELVDIVVPASVEDAVTHEITSVLFRNDRYDVRAGRSARWAGEVLHAGDQWGVSEAFGGLSGPFKGSGSCDLYGPSLFPPFVLEPWFEHGSFRYVDVATTDCSSEPWTWFVKDFPTPVGWHDALVDEASGEPILTMEIVPRLIERGTGEPYIVTGIAERMDPRLLPGDPVVPMVPLGTIDADARPLMRSVTFPRLLQGLAASGPPEVQEALERGAHVVDFLYREDNETRPANGSTQTSLLLPQLTENEAETHYQTYWDLILQNREGEAWAVHAVVYDSVEGALSFGDIWVSCVPAQCRERIAPDGRILDRSVADPFALMQAAREQVAEHDVPKRSADSAVPRAFAIRTNTYDDGRYQRYSMDITWGWSPGTVTLVDTETMSHLAGDASWIHHAAEPYIGRPTSIITGYQDLRDGRTTALSARSGDAGPARVAASSEGVPVEVSDLPLAPPIGLAFVLVLVSVGARLGAAFQAGGHYPFMVWLYAKIPRHEVLTQERRSLIMDLIREDPGITASELQRRTGHGWGAMVHHLGTLERNALVTKLRVGRSLHWYAADQVDQRQRALLAAMQQPDQATILAAAAEGPASAQELADRTGRSRSRVSRLANRLAKMGLLEKTREGRTIRFVRPGSGAPQHEAVESDGVLA